ncbi:MAG: hypothetical protein RL026_1208 [Pseudomonadota bacterium]|jgi:oligopeptide transport system ATP-binding protein
MTEPQVATQPLLEARALRVEYPLPRGTWRRPERFVAVDAASFSLQAGESLAVVGGSGSGKTTLARAVLKLVPLAAGQVLWRGTDIATLEGAALRQRRRDVQMIFQDPLSSLDPRMRIEEILSGPLRVFEPGLPAGQRRERIVAQLEQVGLSAAQLSRYPHQFSGGQAQRIGIARALLARPAVLLCDEPVASLDLVTRAQVLDLLADLQQQGLALLFISHDLAAVRRLCQRVMVLQQGRVVEEGATDTLLQRPRHPCTRQLLDAVLAADPRRMRARQRGSASSS